MAKSNGITIVQATEAHVENLKGRLRESDIQEIRASSGRNPDFSLEMSWRLSPLCWAAEKQDKQGTRTISIFGASRISLLSEKGIPWMLGSEELNGAGLEVGRCSRQYVLEMKRHFRLLENYIDARQKRSIRWLQWCGFHVEPAEPYGVLGLPFHRFWWL